MVEEEEEEEEEEEGNYEIMEKRWVGRLSMPTHRYQVTT